MAYLQKTQRSEPIPMTAQRPTKIHTIQQMAAATNM
jgi:hypothetical protein